MTRSAAAVISKLGPRGPPGVHAALGDEDGEVGDAGAAAAELDDRGHRHLAAAELAPVFLAASFCDGCRGNGVVDGGPVEGGRRVPHCSLRSVNNLAPMVGTADRKPTLGDSPRVQP